MADSLTYTQLLEVLADLVAKKSSGTLYIRSDCNHVISFALDGGKIYAVYHGPRRGRNALSLISAISGGTYQFEATPLSAKPQDLPSTPEILELISTPQQGRAAPALGEAGGSAVSEEKRNMVCGELKRLLTEHLGPIADMVFDDAIQDIEDFCSTPERTLQLIDRLADDIEDSEETVQFREKANAVVLRLME